MKLAQRAYRLLVAAASSLQSPFLFVVRVYWGIQFFQSGWGKLHDIQKVVGFFTELGIPLPALNAWLVGLAECVGGALLILGLGSRLIALVLSVDMIVAYATADREALGTVFSSDPGKFFEATPFSFLFASLTILIFGPGKFSLDYWIERKLPQRVAGDPRSTKSD